MLGKLWKKPWQFDQPWSSASPTSARCHSLVDLLKCRSSPQWLPPPSGPSYVFTHVCCWALWAALFVQKVQYINISIQFDTRRWPNSQFTSTSLLFRYMWCMCMYIKVYSMNMKLLHFISIFMFYWLKPKLLMKLMIPKTVKKMNKTGWQLLKEFFFLFLFTEAYIQYLDEWIK